MVRIDLPITYIGGNCHGMQNDFGSPDWIKHHKSIKLPDYKYIESVYREYNKSIWVVHWETTYGDQSLNWT